MSGPSERPPAPSRRRRVVAPDEQTLWRRVVRDATPLDPPSPPPEEAAAASAEPLPAPAAPPPPDLPPRSAPRWLKPVGSTAPSPMGFDLVEREVAPVGRPAAGLDRRNAERLRRGEREPDSRIDLHGMSAERAHRALDRRIAAALAAGHRLVLVITGKGGRRRDPQDAPFIRADQGVLRQQVPGWLARGPHARSIVGVYRAHPRHGGAGALYVYLKKRR